MAIAWEKDVENNLTRWYNYDDIGRVTTVNDINLRKTVTTYDDTNRKVTVKNDLHTFGDGKLQTVTHYDQLGRVTLAQHSDGTPINGINDGIKIKTVDAHTTSGRRVITTTPYRNLTDSTLEWKCTQYDLLGRVASIASFRGSTQPASCTQTTNRIGLLPRLLGMSAK